MWGHGCVCCCNVVQLPSLLLLQKLCVKHTQAHKHNLAVLELMHMPVACVSLWLV